MDQTTIEQKADGRSDRGGRPRCSFKQCDRNKDSSPRCCAQSSKVMEYRLSVRLTWHDSQWFEHMAYLDSSPYRRA